MSDTYTVKTRRLHSLIALVVGGFFLFAGLDLRFFHTLPTQLSPDSWWWLIPAILGGLAVFGGARTLFKPMTLLLADSNGITIYSGGSEKEWNKKTKSWDTTRSKGEACLIPWAQVRSIEEREIVTEYSEGAGKPPGMLLAGNTTGVGDHKRHVAWGFQVLCDNCLKLDGFDTVGFSKAWNDYEEGDLVGMGKKERDSLKPEDMLSGVFLSGKGMNKNVKSVMETLLAMQAECSAN